jgi:hypothetical protein
MKKLVLLLLQFYGAAIFVFTLPGDMAFRQDSQRSRNLDVWKYRLGDRLEWAAMSWDDMSWETVGLKDLRKETPGVHWFRASIEIGGEPSDSDLLAISFVNLPMAYDVFWDGTRIGSNGRVGATGDEEVPGRFTYFVRLGRELTGPGLHKAALRVSNWHGTVHSPEFGVYFGYSSVLQDAPRDFLDPDLLYMGIYLTAVLFCFALFLGGGRHRSYLLFGAYCLFQFLIWSIDYAAYSAHIRVPAFAWMSALAFYGEYLSCLALVVFLLVHFESPRKGRHLGLSLLALALLEASGARLRLGMALPLSVTMAYSAGLVAQAVRRRKPGSAISLAAILSSLVINLYRLCYTFIPAAMLVSNKYLSTLGNGFFLSCIIFSISMTIREQNLRLESLQLKSQRLETELLKKSIQPHFIMNTLLSIKSWFGKDPAKAEKLIEALGEEFHIISRIASEKAIPVEEEIELCRRHLELMGYRRDARYELRTEGPCCQGEIPPMVFHTLVENGLTHAYGPKEDGVFRLVCAATPDEIRFRLSNDGSRLARLGGQSEAQIEEGMGLRYVKARLEESYPGRWRMTYGLAGGSWDVEIVIAK